MARASGATRPRGLFRLFRWGLEKIYDLYHPLLVRVLRPTVAIGVTGGSINVLSLIGTLFVTPGLYRLAHRIEQPARP